MIKKCEYCGIAGVVEQNKFECAKFKKAFTLGENILTNCNYFIEKIIEDGEPFTPQQHLLIKEQELSAKHMKGFI